MKHFRWMFPQKMEKRTAAVFAYIWTVHFLQQTEIRSKFLQATKIQPYNRRTDAIKEDIRNEKKTVQVLLGAALIAAMCLGAPTTAFAGETTTKEETAEKTK